MAKHREIKEYFVEDKKIICPICNSDKFWHRTTLMNTAGASFFGFDWANKEADNLICEKCSYVHWFFFDDGRGFID